MTPYGLKLEYALNERRRRFQDEWLFKWHFIGKDGPVEIDRFDGGTIKYGGIKFDGTARRVYWSTLSRYLRKTVDQVFSEAQSELSAYPLDQAIEATREAGELLGQFCLRIERALAKDRILRGNGTEFPPIDTASARGLNPGTEIQSRAESLRKYLEALAAEKSPKSSVSGPTDILIARPTFMGVGIDLNAAWKKRRSLFNLLTRRR